jgi:ring-1,2-phenylacetyl-CoA epoxidase subunit PaaC
VSNELSNDLAAALGSMLLGMADDELILGHRDSEWTGHAPILEEDIAFSNIAQDEMGHASIWYGLLGDLGWDSADRLIFTRDAGSYRNVHMMELPIGDWAFSMMRQYLFDALEMVRATRLLESDYRPLAEAAAKIRSEELYHYRHTSNWILRLGQGTGESNRRTQAALDALWPYAGQLFRPADDEFFLIEAGITPRREEVREAWQAAVAPFLEKSGLRIPTAKGSVTEPRSQHMKYLKELLTDLQEVARLDPDAQW